MIAPHPINKKKEIIDTISQILGTDSQTVINTFYQEIEKSIPSDVSTNEMFKSVLLVATSFIEKDPIYDKLAAGLLLCRIYWEVFTDTSPAKSTYQQLFVNNIKILTKKDILDKRLSEFDLEKLSQSLVPERDNLFNYLGLETLAALNEKDKNEKAVSFYQLISNLRFVPSTPTLFHSGLVRPQLSSCFLTTVEDDLNHIFKSLNDKANLLKYSGLIPFLKLANDTTGAINRSGRRRGASVAYLEVWHLEIEDFLDCRRNVDSCNIRSPQDHVGVVHCSNLCTEIALNTSEKETAVCNLGSINLARHVREEKLEDNLLQETINIAIRMLDNVIDLNYYPTREAEYSNFQHRPIGLGMMGFQDALFQLNINYNSLAALEFTDNLTEKFSYYAILASCQLAEERGTYSSYQGSK
ncbi:16362_t:CDS:2 [Cetraspora pellucida]|uniref:16362_t:CDS:1 n=1 Tax=Cetraspora pellucida TaxID=1433469 RepID=A0ACA9MMU0_9GLOM|nr:16362_t:CDS:2 [Cetraspora pellucida]